MSKQQQQPQHSIIVRAHNQNDTHIATITASLDKDQATTIARALNELFSQQNVKMYARPEVSDLNVNP